MLTPVGDRRRQVADELYDALVKQGASFWEHVYPMFLARDITRHDLRELVRRGLRESRGRYKSLLKLFGMSSGDYRRFMNFLAAHECGVGVREFRGGPSTSRAESEAPASVLRDYGIAGRIPGGIGFTCSVARYPRPRGNLRGAVAATGASRIHAVQKEGR